MSLNDYLKCPGLAHALAVVPMMTPCPDCGAAVEIWSDEKQRRCGRCGAMALNPALRFQQIQPARAAEMSDERIEALFLAEMARELGASGAALVEAADIVVADHLAGLCRSGCPNFGKSMSCPPNVSGPEGFRQMAGAARFGLVVKLDATREIMMSSQRREVMQVLHQIVSGLEKAARERGFAGARAFAGGNCKDLFCADRKDCRVLTQRGECRNPDVARPSMSGFGVDVSRLAQSAGWSQESIGPKSWSNADSPVPAYGLVLLG